MEHANIRNKIIRQTEHNRVNNPTCQKADQLAIYKCKPGVNLGCIVKHILDGGQSRTVKSCTMTEPSQNILREGWLTVGVG